MSYVTNINPSTIPTPINNETKGTIWEQIGKVITSIFSNSQNTTYLNYIPNYQIKSENNTAVLLLGVAVVFIILIATKVIRF